MGTTYLLDTNIVIYLLNGTLNSDNSLEIAQAAKSPANISVITKMELLGWKAPTKEEEVECKDFVNHSFVFSISDEIVDKTIEFRRRFPSIKLPDAIIAATAFVNGFTLLSRNESDFLKIDGLMANNPFSKV